MAETDPAPRTNALARETSPYLLQHANNPVDWMPWGAEALARARDEDKPIFLSIGYSSCHWCHVMEHESFSNPQIAKIVNEHYVAIKVDREERPDLDDLYMQTVIMMNQGRGGWPMSVFLTPALKPFYSGTYFPPNDRQGMPGFPRVLVTLAEMWKSERGKVVESAEEIVRHLAEQEDAIGVSGGRPVTPAINAAAIASLRSRYDRVSGGFGGAPKFPPSMAIHLLLAEHARSGDADTLEMASHTLDRMARGGMYDQLGGGFHRYSTDGEWLVPHFEKMLYDNALLAPVYFDASLVTGGEFFLRVGREILDYVLRDMTDPAGGFYSAEDADSEGVEGKFFVWTPEEIAGVLGEADAELFCRFYDVTPQGNFEGENILNIPVPLDEFAASERIGAKELQARLDAMRAKLFERREGRIHPFRDRKVLAAWNGLMITAMARGAQVTGDARYREAADRAADFVLTEMSDPGGLLLRTWNGESTGARAKIPGFIDDYAFMVCGLIDLYETTFDPARLEQADRLAGIMIARFHDADRTGFFTNDGEDESVLLRRKDVHDGAVPSGGSGAVLGLLRLAALLDRQEYHRIALETIQGMEAYLSRIPGAVHHLIRAIAFVTDRPKEIAIVGDLGSEAGSALVREVHRRFLPCRVIAGAKEAEAGLGFNARVPLLRDRRAEGGKPTAYVCENYACKRPVTTPAELAAQLGA